MREIKFRAWDTKHREMIEEIKIFPEYNWLVQSDNDALCERERASENQLILMQYTGLKDKNGKEIYEGDITKEEFNSGIKNCEVVFESGGFFIKNEKAEILDNLHWHSNGLVVIGNIYENPELLTNPL